MNKDSVWERRADAGRGSEQMRVVCPPAGLTDSASKWVCSMPSAMLSYAPIPNCCGLGVGLGGREGTWKCFVPTCWKMPSALHQPANPSKSILLGSQTLSHMYGASITKVWAVWEHFCNFVSCYQTLRYSTTLESAVILSNALKYRVLGDRIWSEFIFTCLQWL